MVTIAKMEKVIERLHDGFEDIRVDLDDDIKWFEKTLPDIENCFEFLRKRAMSTRDNVLLFGLFWPNINRDMKRDEFIQRLTIIIWSNYVFSLSSVEYFLKSIIKTTSKGPLVDWLRQKTEEYSQNGRPFWMYLQSIMNESKRRELINKSQLKSWRGMSILRNAIIHNNGVFENRRELRIGDIELATKAGESVEIMLISYPRFLATLINLTRNWIENYLIPHEI